ncbi:peptide-N4-asparagine amidase [Ktedonobacter racemifer]|uniref:Peptide N-acetyl-beta-D-glucosaminyl asparaginase amidase A N-terminal domain-containing protein n=1 Tax=Ktedonobacter racemifer DSM 44963 TaxID=485913 RepID=D6TC97_KTERA|nr:peptide-N4-asparagine amidase [Ktedonobacter racemifer]EFH89914.1 hypothetical protein Krac_11503 [Ktedonobacter racemifer DSM 44963]
MKISTFFHRFALILVPLLLLGALVFGSVQIAFGQGGGAGRRPHHVVALANGSPIGSANPIAFDEPVVLPSTRPATIPILTDQSFGNAPPPAQSTVSIPAGHWQKAILTINGTQKGRQFDRLLLVWAANTQIFTGVTPEPTQAGISWTVQKDVTAYLPLLIPYHR